jgi:hypothetical protein
LIIALKGILLVLRFITPCSDVPHLSGNKKDVRAEHPREYQYQEDRGGLRKPFVGGDLAIVVDEVARPIGFFPAFQAADIQPSSKTYGKCVVQVERTLQRFGYAHWH